MSKLWASKFATRLVLSLVMDMIKHCQTTQSIKFVISLQHLKNEVRNGGHFWHADKRQSFYKVVLSFLVKVARHTQNTQNVKLVIFFQYIKKKLPQLPFVLLQCKRYFIGVQSCSLLLVLFYVLQLSVWKYQLVTIFKYQLEETYHSKFSYPIRFLCL